MIFLHGIFIQYEQGLALKKIGEIFLFCYPVILKKMAICLKVWSSWWILQ